MSNQLGKILSLSYDSAVASKTSALKTYYRSVRLIKNTGYVNPELPSYITQVLLCGNCVDPETRNLYVFYIDTSVYASAWIIEFNIDSRRSNVVYYDKNNDIGFDPLYKIYNPRVVHGRLVWTDDKNPIYQMDILRAKKSFVLKIGYGRYPDTEEWSAIRTYGLDQVVSNGNGYYKSIEYNNMGNEPRFSPDSWLDLKCLIEDAYYSMKVENFLLEPMPPKHPPEVTYQADSSRKINNLKQTLFQFCYRWIYMDWRKSTLSPASIVPVPQAEEETATGLANELISLNNKLQIVVNSGGEEVRAIEIIGRSSADPSKWFLIETINKFEPQERGLGISRDAEPNYAKITITLPAATVSGTNVAVPARVDMRMLIQTPMAWVTYVKSSLDGMIWLGAEFSVTVKVDAVITCPPYAYLISKPLWITVLDHNGEPMFGEYLIWDGDTISVFPNEPNLGAERTGVIRLETGYGDFTVINVTQLAHVPPVEPPDRTIQVLIDPAYPDDAHRMTFTLVSAAVVAGTNQVNFTLIPDHPDFANGDTFVLLWKAYMNQTPQGTGGVLVYDNVSNDVTLHIGSIIVPTDGDEVIIFISAFYLLPVDQRINLPLPTVLNSFVASAVWNMIWTAAQYAFAEAIQTVITCPATAYLTSKPEWLTIRIASGYDIPEGWVISTGDVLYVFPKEANIGVERSGFIVLDSPQGDNAQIAVLQQAVVVPPADVPIDCSVMKFEEETDLVLNSSSASGLSLSKIVSCVIDIDHPIFTGSTYMTLYWRAKVNGSWMGTGNLQAQQGSNSFEVALDSVMYAGDIVIIYLASFNF